MRYFYGLDPNDAPYLFPIKAAKFYPVVVNTERMGLPDREALKFERLSRIFSDFFVRSPRTIFFNQRYADRFMDVPVSAFAFTGQTRHPSRMLARLEELIPPSNTSMYLIKTLDIRPKNAGVILHSKEFVLEMKFYIIRPAYLHELNIMLRKVLIDEMLETL